MARPTKARVVLAGTAIGQGPQIRRLSAQVQLEKLVRMPLVRRYMGEPAVTRPLIAMLTIVDSTINARIENHTRVPLVIQMGQVAI